MKQTIIIKLLSRSISQSSHTIEQLSWISACTFT